jgi:hypothetical protein
MTIRERLQELEKQRAALSLLISRFNADREAALAALPQRFGYQSLNGFIAAVTAAYSPEKRQYRRRKTTSAKQPKATTAAATPATREPTPVRRNGDAQQAPVLPAGSDLNDPQNFGTLPDVSLLDTPVAADSAYYDRIALALTQARKVLSTSGVPAAVWRAWRSYEQKTSGILRNRHTQDMARS